MVTCYNFRQKEVMLLGKLFPVNDRVDAFHRTGRVKIWLLVPALSIII